MDKKQPLSPKDDFMMSFFDVDPKSQYPDLAAKKDNLKYTDTFNIFKIDNDVRKSI